MEIDWGSVRRLLVVLAVPLASWLNAKYGVSSEAFSAAFDQLMTVLAGVYILAGNVKAVLVSSHAAKVEVAKVQAGPVVEATAVPPDTGTASQVKP